MTAYAAVPIKASSGTTTEPGHRRRLRLWCDRHRVDGSSGFFGCRFRYLGCPATSTRHLSPCQVMSSMDAVAATSPRLTVSTGVKHSCKLSPPCVYSIPPLKEPMPGASAIRTESDQRQLTTRSPSPFADVFRTAHRPQRVSVRNFGSSTLGKPPEGATTVVRDHLDGLPSCSEQALNRSAISRTCSSIRLASFHPCSCPMWSRSPISVHARPPGSPTSSPPRTW